MFFAGSGEMSEWLKEHAWKACVGETLPWVRIPLSPPPISNVETTGEVPERSNGAVSKTVDRATGPWVRIPPSPPFASAWEARVLDAPPRGTLRYWFRPLFGSFEHRGIQYRRAAPDEPAVPQSMTSTS